MKMHSNESLKQVVSVPLSEHQAATEKLFEVIHAASRPPSHVSHNVMSTLKDLFDQSLEKDQKLVDAVEKLLQHQTQQNRLLELEKQVQEQDALIYNYASKLRLGEQNLRRALKKHQQVLDTVNAPNTRRLDPRDVVAYSHRISGTTSAPAYWKPGFPMFGFAPPAPQEQMMRAGVLSRGEVAEIVTTEPIAKDTGTQQTKPTAVDQVQVPLGISLPDLDVSKMMPPGWKPGDPIVLPKEMVIPQATEEFIQQHNIQVPEGWKPGDPIPFTALQNASKRENSGTTDDASDIKRRKLDEEEESSSDSDSDSDERTHTISLSLSSDEDSD